MVKFGHIADVHLGGWKQEPMNELNFGSFRRAIDICIENKVDFVLFAGDLFDSAYPPIETLKETFAEFRKLNDAKIPCFIIAGSHDYSVSGKTFLDVLERAGFCKNVFNFEERNDFIYLNPTLHERVAIYGYPGKKSGLEVQELKKVKLNDAPGMFKIFMLHTTLDRVAGSLPIEYVNSDELPKADYYALGHIHVLYDKDNFVYPGPLFPNNFRELEDLSHGHFVIVDTESSQVIERIKLPSKQVEKISVELNDGITGTDKIISELEKRNLCDKVILLRIFGELTKGKNSDIKFSRIEEYAKSKDCYFILKNTHDLKTKEFEVDAAVSAKNSENAEEEIINSYSAENPSDFNSMIPELMNALSTEKQEDEKTEIFNNRLLGEARKILKF
jgi:hypothetical protein